VKFAALKKQLSPDAGAFARANCGKISPADCEHILTLAVETGVVQPNLVQAWADKNLGVDCTGFAVAYYDWLGLINIERYSGGISCPVLLNKAKHNHQPPGDSPLIWELDDVQEDDMVLWMNDAGKETRAPGHIAIVYDTSPDLGILCTAESPGSNDGQGHRGPQLKQRTWNGRNKGGAPHYVLLDNTDEVLVVRPPAMFG
jgi:hypothetical protein